MRHAQLVMGPAGCGAHPPWRLTARDARAVWTCVICAASKLRAHMATFVPLLRVSGVSECACAGKSTYCNAMYEHGLATKRSFRIVNMDPAAESFKYPVSIDIRDLISLEDVMEEMELGPNGGLVYAFEYIDENQEWLHEQLGDDDDEYYIFDCPGQIELYSHVPVMRSLVQVFHKIFVLVTIGEL